MVILFGEEVSTDGLGSPNEADEVNEQKECHQVFYFCDKRRQNAGRFERKFWLFSAATCPGPGRHADSTSILWTCIIYIYISCIMHIHHIYI